MGGREGATVSDGSMGRAAVSVLEPAGVAEGLLIHTSLMLKEMNVYRWESGA